MYENICSSSQISDRVSSFRASQGGELQSIPNHNQTGERIQGSINSEIPEMIPIMEVCKRIPGLSYDFLRKGCLSGKIVHIRVGNGKFLINFGRLVEWLNTSCGEDDDK